MAEDSGKKPEITVPRKAESKQAQTIARETGMVPCACLWGQQAGFQGGVYRGMYMLFFS